MSKWRPVSKNCFYVIPDIHGSLSNLNLILDRILPLRKSDGGQDKLIFLGDYIDRHVNSHLVIDELIVLKEKYKDNVIFLKGNHEDFFLKAIGEIECNFQQQYFNYQMWLNNGGIETLYGYLQRNNLDENPLAFPKSKIRSLIPDSHVTFLKECLPYYENDNYIFVHGGCDPHNLLINQEQEVLLWDRNLFKFVRSCILSNQEDKIDWNKIIVCGHSGPKIIIHEKYMMLDAGSPSKLLVLELNSLEAFIADKDNDRLVKFDINKTSKDDLKISFKKENMR